MVNVKQEIEEVKKVKEEPTGGAPWHVTVKSEKVKKELVTVIKPAPTHPWGGIVKGEDATVSAKAAVKTDQPPKKRVRGHGVSVERVQKARKEEEIDVTRLAKWEQEPGDSVAAPEDEGRLVSLKNYAAVEAGTGRYGLIDRGVHETGIQTLLMHTPRRRDTEQEPDVRPGSILRVSSTAKGGSSGPLRVRFTTPARYYSPGTRVTTLCIGVDAADWEELMPQRRRI
jgi:hypothetical protein